MATQVPIANPRMRETYLVRSLVEEAIHSSQLEGASTTRQVAKEMIREGRSPRTRSEQMIFNNYHAMEFIQEYKHEPIAPERVLELHRILTEDTLDDPQMIGRFRRPADEIRVEDPRDGSVLHVPPHARELESRMERLCEFANQTNSKPFVPPVVRAILLHFALAYDHPFVDGNGRTARALFYWLMANRDYWIVEFASISEIIKRAPAQYGRAFLYTETDENDATYFVIHQLGVIKKSIQELYAYLDRESVKYHSAERLLQRNASLLSKLNDRQVYLLKHALKHPGETYTIQGHRQTHRVVYETARRDLTELSERFRLLQQHRRGRRYVFSAPKDLRKRIEQPMRQRRNRSR